MIGPYMNALSKTRSRRPARLGSSLTSAAAARKTITAVACAASLLGAATVTRTASAQEIQLTGPLAGAPAVRHERLYRDGRFELAPTVSFTLLSEYKRTILFGARAQYNITDWLGVGLWGAYGAVQINTNLTDEIGTTAKSEAQTAVNVPSPATNFSNQVAEMQWVAVPQLQLTPFRGKLAVFQKIFINADAYLHGGLGFVGLKERGDCGGGASTGQPACTSQASFALASRTALSPSFGLGFNFYIGDFMSLGVEYRALPFSWNQGGFDTRGGNPNGNFPDNKITSADETFTFNQMLTISLGFSFPTTPKLNQ
jgi:outer membrane beta-barrel protein